VRAVPPRLRLLSQVTLEQYLLGRKSLGSFIFCLKKHMVKTNTSFSHNSLLILTKP
jgi:hypothetical protein